MSTPVSTAENPLPDLREKLAGLVRNFDRDSGGQSCLIRQMAQQEPQAFFGCAMELLARPDESRGWQFLVATLSESGFLLRAIRDPGLNREQAIGLARSAALAGQMVDVAVARYLSENVQEIGQGDALPAEILRLLDVLAEISDGVRILPSLMALGRHPNLYLQSKAVLMIGRINRNVKWLLNRLRDPDARVRANAIEAIWGVDTDETRRLLRAAARDGNNRIAGNALMALYRLGDCWAIPELIDMASHESRRFRATAAWVIGETGDPRFTRLLGRMVGEANTAVRARAFTALSRIKAATMTARQAGEWKVIGVLGRGPRAGKREVQVEVCSTDGARRADVLPTQFFLTEDGRDVTAYSVEERASPGTLAVAFLYPRAGEVDGGCCGSFREGALRALDWKRPGDLWSAVPYLGEAETGIEATLLDQTIAIAPDSASQGPPLQYARDREVATKAFGRAIPQAECSDLWSTIRRSVQIVPGNARAQRHVIVYGEREVREPAIYPELVSAALTSRTTVHVVSLTANPVLQNLCQTTKGTFRIATSTEVPDWAEQGYGGLLARYTIHYESGPSDATALTIRVQSQAGWGETRVAMPG